MIENASPLLQTVLGTLFTWGLTAIGAGLVIVFDGTKVSSSIVLTPFVLSSLRYHRLPCTENFFLIARAEKVAGCEPGFRCWRNDSRILLVITGASHRIGRTVRHVREERGIFVYSSCGRLLSRRSVRVHGRRVSIRLQCVTVQFLDRYIKFGS